MAVDPQTTEAQFEVSVRSIAGGRYLVTLMNGFILYYNNQQDMLKALPKLFKEDYYTVDPKAKQQEITLHTAIPGGKRPN